MVAGELKETGQSLVTAQSVYTSALCCVVTVEHCTRRKPRRQFLRFFHENHCDTQLAARSAHFTAVSTSTQPSTLQGTVN